MFSMAAHIPSLQLVTSLLDSTKTGARGYVLVKGPWAGLTDHPSAEFRPNLTMNLPGTGSFRHSPSHLGSVQIYVFLTH